MSSFSWNAATIAGKSFAIIIMLLVNAPSLGQSLEDDELEKAKATCTELGFTLGTEKHGDCVLKMMDN